MSSTRADHSANPISTEQATPFSQAQAGALQLFDTLSQQLRPFSPIASDTLSLYVCGPTVYDDAHLGHARCYITWDILFRHLRVLGYNVHYVRNVTDVDDKIINRAKAENTTYQEISNRYFQRFSQDMQALNVSPPTQEPKATDHIALMLEAIAALIEKGAAYVAPDGTVYFRSGAFSDYGKLSKKPLEDLRAGARVELDPNKESPLDFALWKATEADDAFAWDSAWGRGRPGWHIECSAMNYAAFGPKIDIHAGGADLIFPHHENEIAQSECWSGEKPFANFWMHNGFVNVSGEKMSKSLGNFATIRTLLERYDANVIRYFLLQHHYRMPVDFNDEALEGAQNRMRKIYRLLKKTLGQQAPRPDFNALPSAYLDAMAEDLNTSKALAILNQTLQQLELAETSDSALEQGIAIWEALGFRFDLIQKEDALPLEPLKQLAQQYDIADQETGEAILHGLIDYRKSAKTQKNYALADGVRNALMEIGIQLMDNKDGSTGYESVS